MMALLVMIGFIGVYVLFQVVILPRMGVSP